MNTKQLENRDWEIISSYLSGEMEKEEKQSFEKMLTSNPLYQQAIDASKKDFDFIDKQIEFNEFDIDTAWSNINKHINTTKKIQFTFRKALQFAAIFIVTIGLSFAAWQINSTSNKLQVVENKSEVQKIIQLSDGSIVTLGINSTLHFPKKFTNATRTVELNGKAFFDITKNPKQAFIIKMNHANVKVLGTSFSVNSSKEKVEVLVKTGKVLFSDSKEPKRNLILIKNDFAILKGKSLEKKALQDENYLSWKTQKMIFRNMTLGEVAKIINKTYHVNIHFQNSNIKQNNLNTTFDRDPIENVLKNICLPFNLTYVNIDDKIIIKEKK